MSFPQVLEQLNASELAIQWKEIESLKTDLLPVEQFDLALLPENIADFVADISERMDNTPCDFAGIGVMCALGSLLGRKIGIHPKKYDDWLVVPNLWGLAVGRPSMKKSPTLEEAIKPLRRLEMDAKEAHAESMEEHLIAVRVSEMKIKKAEKDAQKAIDKGNEQVAENLLREVLVDIEPPHLPRFMVNDTTVEKLGELLAANPSGLLLFRDEASGWLKGLDREDRSNDRAFFLEAFNGTGSYTYDRIGRGTVFIPSMTISVLGGIQPGKLQPYLMAQKDGGGDDGLVERLQLMVYPDVGSFKHVDRWPNTDAKSRAYKVFESFAEIPYTGGNIPALRFANDAQDYFDSWYIRLMTSCRSGSYSAQMESHLSKYPSLMPSLALIIHIAESGPTDEVGLKATMMAAAWCEYLESHVRRVYALVDDPYYGARSLLNHIDQLNNPFTISDISNKNWSGLKSKEQRHQAVKILCERNYLYAEEVPTASKSKINYFINPKALKGEV